MNSLEPAEPTNPQFAVDGNDLCLLRDGQDAFPAMLSAILGAKSEVLLEMYWIGDDAVGLRFLDALRARAEAGIRVRVIYDSLGSGDLPVGFFAPLLAAGGKVVEYHSISPFVETFRVDRLERRDHRKMLVVDETLGFVGGINLARQWLPREEGGEGWRDDMVSVQGKAAGELRSLFYRTWRKASGEPPPLDVRPLSKHRSGRVWVTVSQWRSRRSIHKEYVHRIRQAKSRVDIANSYFVPDRDVRRVLFAAVMRGVRVRVLVPAESDVPVVQYATEALFDTLLRHGVEVYVLPGTMLHAKTAIIDGAFTTIGSYNLDQRSWHKNLEVNLAVLDEAFAKHVQDWFEHDLSSASRVHLGAWQSRGMTRRSLEWASYLFRKLW